MCYNNQICMQSNYRQDNQKYPVKLESPHSQKQKYRTYAHGQQQLQKIYHSNTIKIRAKCRENNLIEFGCCNKNCRRPSFVCSNRQCSCRLNHQDDCCYIQLERLVKKINKRSQPLQQRIHKIQTNIQSVIHQLQITKKKLSNLIQPQHQKAGNLKFSQQQINLMNCLSSSIQKQQYIRGDDLQNIVQNLKNLKSCERQLQQKLISNMDSGMQMIEDIMAKNLRLLQEQINKIQQSKLRNYRQINSKQKQKQKQRFVITSSNRKQQKKRYYQQQRQFQDIKENALNSDESIFIEELTCQQQAGQAQIEFEPFSLSVTNIQPPFKAQKPLQSQSKFLSVLQPLNRSTLWHQSKIVSIHPTKKCLTQFFKHNQANKHKNIKSSTLLYQSSTMNPKISQLSKTCNKKNKLLFLLQTQYQQIIGWFFGENSYLQTNKKTLTSSLKQQFFFSLTLNQKFPSNHIQNSQIIVCDSNQYKLLIFNGLIAISQYQNKLICELNLKNDKCFGLLSEKLTYQNGYRRLLGNQKNKKDCVLKQIEVWQVQF